jgi:energy-coupling factor transporter ATP-binding protein EcfA2
MVVRRTERGYEIDGHDVARIEVEVVDHRVTRARAHPYRAELVAATEDLITHYVAPHLRQLEGKPTLHGSAVAIEGRVVAFVGRSGMGKSTLASSFAGLSTFVTDDSVVLEPADDRVMVVPTRATSRLRHDSLAELATPTSGRDLGDKREIDLTGASESLPLAAIYVLERSETGVRLEPVRRRDAVLLLASQLHRIDPTDPELLAREVDYLETITGRVRVVKLAYPRRYAELPRVHRAILEDLERA